MTKTVSRNKNKKIEEMQISSNSFIENIFSVKNDHRRTHKIITILGIAL